MHMVVVEREVKRATFLDTKYSDVLLPFKIFGAAVKIMYFMLINSMPLFKAMIMRTTSTLFAFLPRIFATHSTTSLPRECTLLMIYSIQTNINADTLASKKYSPLWSSSRI